MNAIIESVARRQKAITKSIKQGKGLEGVAYKFASVCKNGLAMTNAGGAIVKEADDKNYSIPFTISVLSEDRDGDVVIPTGARLNNYRRNPVVFFGHQDWEIPIGTSRSPSGELCVYPREKDIKAVWFCDYHDPDAHFIYGKV
jgi:hypothetical protein